MANLRFALGMLALAKKYGIASTDDACAMALETGAVEYRFARRYLERNPPLPFGLHQVDPLPVLKEKDGIAISQIEQ